MKISYITSALLLTSSLILSENVFAGKHSHEKNDEPRGNVRPKFYEVNLEKRKNAKVAAKKEAAKPAVRPQKAARKAPKDAVQNDLKKNLKKGAAKNHKSSAAGEWFKPGDTQKVRDFFTKHNDMLHPGGIRVTGEDVLESKSSKVLMEILFRNKPFDKNNKEKVYLFSQKKIAEILKALEMAEQHLRTRNKQWKQWSRKEYKRKRDDERKVKARAKLYKKGAK